MRFGELEDYEKVHGDCNVPQGWIENPPLANWVDHQRELYKKGQMDPERVQWLTRLGFSWDPLEKVWEEMIRLLTVYKKNHRGDVPKGYEVEGIKLGKWLQTQRKKYKKGEMDPERERRLMRELGFVFKPLE